MFAFADDKGRLWNGEYGKLLTSEDLLESREIQMFFHASNDWLYGMLHIPPPEIMKGVGIVFCHAFGDERKRTQRLLARTARRFASSGFHVLRFDLYGCGDSFGEFEDANLDIWIQDILSAASLLKKQNGMKKVGLLGVGLGAVLALCACEMDEKFDFAVLWSPFVSGNRYLRLYAQMEKLWSVYNKQSVKDNSKSKSDEKNIFEGYSVSDIMIEQIRKIDLFARNSSPIDHLFVIEVTKKNRLGRPFRQLKDIWNIPVEAVRGDLFFGKREFSAWSEIIEVSLNWMNRLNLP